MLKKASIFVVLFFCIPSCASATQHSPEPIEKVILISIDTLRADYLGCYNPKAKATPELDRFATSNLICKNVTSQSATTAPSHKSIFYSVYPSIHKTSLRGRPLEKLSSPIEIIRAGGFRTAAFTGGANLATHSVLLVDLKLTGSRKQIRSSNIKRRRCNRRHSIG